MKRTAAGSAINLMINFLLCIK